jgi:hypothetical protein
VSPLRLTQPKLISRDVLMKVHVHEGSGASKKSSKGSAEVQVPERAARVAERPIR